jgi:hypothetical protein
VSTTPVSNVLNGQVQITGDPTVVGSTVDVSFEVKNTGNAPTLPPLTLAVPLPDGYTYVPVAPARAAAASANWTCTLVGQTVFCQWEDQLDPGESTTAHVHLQVNAAPSSGSALFAYLTTPGVPGSAQNVLQVPLGQPQASTTDVAVTQQVSVVRDNLARTLTYAIAVTNKGATAADNVVLTDVLVVLRRGRDEAVFAVLSGRESVDDGDGADRSVLSVDRWTSAGGHDGRRAAAFAEDDRRERAVGDVSVAARR